MSIKAYEQRVEEEMACDGFNGMAGFDSVPFPIAMTERQSDHVPVNAMGNHFSK